MIAEKCCTIIKAAAILWNFVLEHEGLDEADKDSDSSDSDSSDSDDDTDEEGEGTTNAATVATPAPRGYRATGEARRRGVVADFLRARGASKKAVADYLKAWLPDGCSRIFRIVCVWPFGLLDYGSATLRCKI